MSENKKLLHPLVSVVIPMYNAANYIEDTLNSVISQTYQNIEVIVVNDASTDESEKIVKRYTESHPKVKLINHTENAGPYRSRITGYEKARGKYLSFIDSDDYLSVDYIRDTVQIAENNNSDIVFANTVIDDANTNSKFIYNLANDLPFTSLEGAEVLDSILSQRGHNYLWHVVWNKLFRKDLWDKVYSYANTLESHLIMCDDIAHSIPLWYYASRVDRAPHSSYFYRLAANNDAATSLKGMTLAKGKKNIQDLKTAFGFVEKFLEQHNVSDKNLFYFSIWKQVYAKIWYKNVDDTVKSATDKKILKELIDTFSTHDKNDNSLETHFYRITTQWNDGFDLLKKSILDPTVKVVSFDIFDTLIVRPFYKPEDIFKLLDSHFKSVNPTLTLLSFYDIRTRAESETRLLHKDNEDITLEQIYDTLSVQYDLSKKVSVELMRREMELEVSYSTRRQSAYDLFSLAKFLGKKVILTTDMYLPEKTIVDILKKSGYKNWDRLYLSSKINKSKAKGSIYPYIANDNSIKPSNILHIGDHEGADYNQALQHGLKAALYPKTITTMYKSGMATKMFENITGATTNYIGQDYHGISIFIAMVANKFFDNPFTTFNKETTFNAHPSMLGYFGLGMHLYGVAYWLLEQSDQNNYDSLTFMARDGYLPKLAFDKLYTHTNHSRTTKSSYLPTSRKAILPLSIFSKDDLNHIDTFINLSNNTFEDIIEHLSEILIDNTKPILLKYRIKPEMKLDEVEYAQVIRVLKECFDSEKANKLRMAFRRTFDGYFAGNSAVFDIGYSAKPEHILAKTFEKEISTYFIHTNPAGAYRSASTASVPLHNFYNFFPFNTGGLRELLISEVAPSCTKYKVSTSGLIEVEFEERHSYSYYEEFVIGQMQKNSLLFIDDVVSLFSEQLNILTYTNQYISLPLEAILSSPTQIDRLVFKPITFEDDLGIGRVNDITEIISFGSNLHETLSGKSKFVKLIAYTILDRGHLIAKVKERTKERTKNTPLLYNLLTKSYKALKAAKKRFKSNR